LERCSLSRPRIGTAGVSKQYRAYRGEPRSEIRDQRPRYTAPRDVYSGDPQPARFRSRRENTIHGANYCWSCERTASGRIRRNAVARRAFKELHPCPATGTASGPCPGYVIDHVVPLKRGGADAVENMQWQTLEEAKAKDRVE
jgi:5-methylcytosine-specific restriction endonuclease McrA